MTKEEAFHLLESTRSHDRLTAARKLAQIAEPDMRERLIEALTCETVVWIRKALESAVLRASGGETASPIETLPWDEIHAEDAAYSKGVEDATRSLLHEINPILGLLRLSARGEIPDYDLSRTKRSLERLGNLLKAIAQLNRAAAEIAFSRFNLGEQIYGLAEAAEHEFGRKVQLFGPERLVVDGNPDLLDIIISNALRNAIEAQSAAGADDPIAIAWDVNDREVWVTILDRGVGLPPGSEYAFDIGRSTKIAHPGMGLAIAQRAAQSLLGNVRLRPREDGGTAFELRWPLS